MPGFVEADLGGTQISTCQVFAPKPVKRDNGGFASEPGFAEHECKNRGTEVALNDPQFES